MTRTGFFAGSFDPPTLGHLDLITRSLAVVDRLVVGVGHNEEKRGWLPVGERVALLAEVVPSGVQVLSFEGLAVTAARACGASLLLRGVRGLADWQAETDMAVCNRRLDPGLPTVFIPASPEVAHISSRLVREVHRSGGDLSLFLPGPVVAHLRASR